MAEIKWTNNDKQDDKNTIKSGAAAFKGAYMCAYCKSVLKISSNDGQLPNCPKCGYDKWIR